MATLISANGGGNLATAATWRNVCTGTGALLTTLSAAESKTNTTYTYGVAFTVTSGETVEGLALHLQRSGVTGTLSITLSDDNGVTATREVTVNLSDLPAAYSWVFFKFGSTLAADGGSDYKVGIKLSAGASGVSIYRGSGTAGDWSHILREDTAPGSLSAGDVFYIFDDLTSAGAKTANTIVMDNTATTDFGAVTVGFGTLNYGTAESTNYYLKVSGDVTVWGGGTLTIGTTGSKMPSTSTAVLELDPTSDGEFGLICKDGSTVTLQGNPLAYCWTYLNSNAAANATSLTTADSTGWADNSVICIGSTSRTYSEYEKGAANGAASGTTLTVDGFAGTGGGLAYAHSGSNGGPNGESTKAEIVNLTRNVIVRSATSTLMAYVYCAAVSTCDWDYAEFYYLGENTAGKRGIEVATTTGSFAMQYCSLHDCEDWGFYSVTASGSPNFSYNVTWSLDSANASNTSSFYVAASSGTPVVTYNVFMSGGGPSSDINLADAGLTFTNNAIVGSAGAISTRSLAISETSGVLLNISSNIIHSGRGIGLALSNHATGTIGSVCVWRCASHGLYVESASNAYTLTIASPVLFGNSTNNLNIAVYGGTYIITSAIINSDPSYTTTNGLNLGGCGHDVYVFNSSFGASSAHTGRDIYIQSTYNVKCYLFSCTLATTPEVTITTSPFSSVFSHKNDTSATTFRTTHSYGVVQAEAAIRHTDSGYAWKMAPSNATYKLICPGPSLFDGFRCAVNSGSAVTVTAWLVRDSSYNGTAPRLALVGNIVADIDDGTNSFSQTSKTITAASNAGPIVVTSAGHGYANGDRVLVDSVGGNTAANGSWAIANKTDNTFELVGSTGNSNYTSGGKVTRWQQLSLSDTPSEQGVIEFYFDCDGTAGNVYVDDVAVTQA
jgi:hypothetical protein